MEPCTCNCINSKVIWNGLTVTWTMAHKLIQHLRRQGWTVFHMGRGIDYVGYWCQHNGDYFTISFWEEGVALIENPAYDMKQDDLQGDGPLHDNVHDCREHWLKNAN